MSSTGKLSDSVKGGNIGKGDQVKRTIAGAVAASPSMGDGMTGITLGVDAVTTAAGGIPMATITRETLSAVQAAARKGLERNNNLNTDPQGSIILSDKKKLEMMALVVSVLYDKVKGMKPAPEDVDDVRDDGNMATAISNLRDDKATAVKYIEEVIRPNVGLMRNKGEDESGRVVPSLTGTTIPSPKPWKVFQTGRERALVTERARMQDVLDAEAVSDKARMDIENEISVEGGGAKPRGRGNKKKTKKKKTKKKKTKTKKRKTKKRKTKKKKTKNLRYRYPTR